nr:ribonuclease R family protein [Chlamydiifrater phoenicopteri]
MVIGTLTINPRKGFGFVHPLDPKDLSFDIFIPPGSLKGAIEGDLVSVRVSESSNNKEGRYKGSIQEVLSRKKTTIVGTIISLQSPLKATVYVPAFGQDTTVKASLLPGRTYQEGDRILLKNEKWSSKGSLSASSFEMEKFLGNLNDATADFDVVKEEFSLTEEFPSEAIQEAESFSQEQISQLAETRKDLRDLLCFTIDSSTAKDFDDAVSLTYDQDNNYILGVHIADVSNYVKPNSALDKEASKRCNSVYFPGKVIPMLPFALSDDLCSLKPNVDRLAVSVFMTFSPEGYLTDYNIFRSIIRSKYRMTYDEVDDIIQRKITHPIAKTIANMHDLSNKFSAIRERRGCIRFVAPSITISLDSKQQPVALVENSQTDSHRLIEEFMLKANEVVAYHISHQGVSLPFRIHEEPNSESLESFARLAKELGFEITFTNQEEPDFQHLLQVTAAGHSLEKFLTSHFIRSMKTAVYSIENKGHYGLRLDYYTHFTSPIRRYADLIVHRLLFDSMAVSEAHLEEIVRNCSNIERVSARAENDYENIKKCRFLKKFLEDAPSTIYEAMVISSTKDGLAFSIPEFFQESFVPSSLLPEEFKEKNEGEIKKYPPGSKFFVRLISVNLMTKEILWEPVIQKGSEKQQGKKIKAQKEKKAKKKPKFCLRKKSSPKSKTSEKKRPSRSKKSEK